MINCLGMKNQTVSKIFTATRFNKFSLNKRAFNIICTILKEKLQIKNAASVYKFVNLFNSSSLKNSTNSYIERFFTILIDNDMFLELEYTFISKILASSELLITSEIEVFKVANRWLNHNFEERSKYAEDIFLKVRLHLLSTLTIRHLLNESKYFKKHGCVKFLSKIIHCKVKFFFKSSRNFHTSRFCNQNYSKLLICGGFNSERYKICNKVSCIDLYKVRDVKAYPSMKTGRLSPKVVYLKGYIYVFGGWSFNDEWIKSIEKYSLTCNKWNKVADMKDGRQNFCVCAFMDKIFLIGDNKARVRTNSCLQFDTSNYSWKEVSKMKEARSHAACAVFEERIVVSGGLITEYDELNSVESYDVLPNKWSSMPNMNSGKRSHSLVVVKNKLFVISKTEDDCEVFDNICKTFITIKSPKFDWFSSIEAHSVVNKIYVVQDRMSKIICYDTNKNEWSEESRKFTKKLRRFSSVKVPCI